MRDLHLCVISLIRLYFLIHDICSLKIGTTFYTNLLLVVNYLASALIYFLQVKTTSEYLIFMLLIIIMLLEHHNGQLWSIV